ncbi:MAG: ArnT family glycosyltransferase [Candidatus Sumerlaeota bacterium]
MPNRKRHLLSRRQALAILLLIVVAGLCLSGRYLAQPDKELALCVVTDDAYYYFQTARNIAAGKGSVSSGGIEHNGYHPLWLLISSFFYKVSPDSAGPFFAIRLILGFGILLAALATLVVYRIARRLGCRRGTAIFAAAVFHLNPYMVELTVSGLEAPLNALLLAGLFLSYLRLDIKRRASWPGILCFGALMGLTYLVRTDNIFFIAILWLGLFYRSIREGQSSDRMIAAGFLAFFIVLPWIMWNAVHFGGLVQGSASALPVVRFRVFLSEYPEVGPVDLFGWRLALVSSWFPSILWSSGLGLLWHAMGLLLIALLAPDRKHAPRIIRRRNRIARAVFAWVLLPTFLIAYLLGAKTSHLAVFDWGLMIFLGLWWGVFWTLLFRSSLPEAFTLKRNLTRLRPLLAAVILLGLVHKGLRLATREWYFVPSDILLALAWGLALEFVIARSRRVLSFAPPRRLAMTILVLGVAVISAWFARKYRAQWGRPTNTYAWELMERVNQLEPLLHANERIGVTDSGLIGYVADVAVVNLDGVVNPEAAEAIEERRLLDYCRREGLQFLIITPRMVTPEILGEKYLDDLERFPPLGPEGYRLRRD